jgi:hypothetical protein
MKRLIALILSAMLLVNVSVDFASAASKPKCNGTNLAKYKKAVKQEREHWQDVIDSRASNDSEYKSLAYRGWLNYAYALEKYSKICKMKMRPEWYEMLDSLPVD